MIRPAPKNEKDLLREILKELKAQGRQSSEDRKALLAVVSSFPWFLVTPLIVLAGFSNAE